jgi:hypothetical protein
LDISDKLSINRGSNGKYLPKKQFEGFGLGRKKLFGPGPDLLIGEDDSTGLNDLDSNIMKKNLFRFIPREPLKLELQLENAEKKLKKINEEIDLNQELNMQNTIKHKKLSESKELTESRIKSYRNQYRELGFAYKAADDINQMKNFVIEKINGMKLGFSQNKLVKNFMEKIPSYKERQKVREAALVNKKLLKEMAKSCDIKREELEFLLAKAEIINSDKNKKRFF